MLNPYRARIARGTLALAATALALAFAVGATPDPMGRWNSVVATGELTYDGPALQPGGPPPAVATGELTYDGPALQPPVVATGELSYDGLSI